MLSRLLGISPNLFRKILIISGSGGGTVFYLGLPENFILRADRKIKWTLKSDGESKETKESINSKDGVWVVEKKKWQDLDTAEWNKVEDKSIKTIYKLILKKEIIQEGENLKVNNPVRGALGLFKVNLIKDNRKDVKEVKLEEINSKEAKAIWLIVAKGKKSVYLIPAVRTSQEDKSSERVQWSNMNKCWKKVYDIWEKGITDLGSWKDNGVLETEELTTLKDTLKSGFVIGRGGKGYGGRLGGWGASKGRGSDIQNFLENKPGKTHGQVTIYRNSGILAGRENRKTVCDKNNKKVNYFPLDVMEIGKSGIREIKNRNTTSSSELEVNEGIENIGIFKWEEVTVSKIGIGDGKENWINWGDAGGLTWTAELLK